MTLVSDDDARPPLILLLWCSIGRMQTLMRQAEAHTPLAALHLHPRTIRFAPSVTTWVGGDLVSSRDSETIASRLMRRVFAEGAVATNGAWVKYREDGVVEFVVEGTWFYWTFDSTEGHWETEPLTKYDLAALADGERHVLRPAAGEDPKLFLDRRQAAANARGDFEPELRRTLIERLLVDQRGPGLATYWLSEDEDSALLALQEPEATYLELDPEDLIGECLDDEDRAFVVE